MHRERTGVAPPRLDDDDCEAGEIYRHLKGPGCEDTLRLSETANRAGINALDRHFYDESFYMDANEGKQALGASRDERP